MKKKIVILGSTGSIGKSTINILKKDFKKIEIVFLSTNKNINELSKQVNFFKVKNVLISDYKKYLENSFSYIFNSVSKEYPATLKLNAVTFRFKSKSKSNNIAPTLEISNP